MDVDKAVARLEQAIAKGEAVLSTHRPNPQNVIGFPTLDSGAFNEWRTQALVCLKSVFGASHTYVEHFDEQVKQPYQGTVKSGIGILKGAKEDLAQEGQEITVPTASANAVQTNNVFVVHGHDEEMKQYVARILSKLGLHPIILHEQPNSGKTIIEKFEFNSDVRFAVLLLSPDDMAFPVSSSAKDAMARARQNVILELGYFVGRLSRDRVFTLKRGDLELPSDFSGIVYTTYDPPGNWRFELVRELKAAGYNVDANTLL